MTDEKITEQLRGAAQDDDLDAEHWRAELTRRLFGTKAPRPKVGRYELVDRIGEGAAGIVYLASDPELDRRVAVKLLRPSVARTVADAERWLAREAKALARLSHPNVVPIHDVGRHEGQVFIALEFVDGSSLRPWLANKPSHDEIIEVMSQAGEGLAAAHDAGLVHRDFKPENVLLGDDGRVRVSDFGIARPSRTAEELGTEPAGDAGTSAQVDASTYASAGTPAYMAPEQFLGDEVDGRTDQFAFCIVLHEAVYGARPFPGNDRTKLAANVIANRRHVPESAAAPPRWLEKIIARGLNGKPEQRYPTMRALLADLRREKARRHWPWVVGVGGLAAAGFALASPTDTNPVQDPCAGAQVALANVWSPEISADIRSAFEQTQAAQAGDAWLRLDRTLNAYGEAWVDAHEQACDAQPSRELVVQRLYCLQSRLLEVESLTSLFADADAQVVQHASTAAVSLRPPTECLFEAAATPIAAASTQRRAEIRQRIARGHAQGNIGRPRQGLALAREAATMAQDLGDRALEAEALLVATALERQLLMARARPEAESTSYAAVLAAEAARRPDLIARAHVEYLATLVNVGNSPRALEWESRARTAVAAVGSPAALVGRIEHSVALAQDILGNDTKAREAIERALTVLDNGTLAARRWLVKALTLSGEFRFQNQDYGSALKDYERALDLAIAEIGPHHVWTAGAHGNIAEVFFASGDYERAREHFEQSLAIRREAYGNDSVWVAHTLGHIGDAALAIHDADGALEAYQEGLERHERQARAAGKIGSRRPSVYDDLQVWLLETWLRRGIALSQLQLGKTDLALREAKLAVNPRLPPNREHPDLTGRNDVVGRVLLAQGKNAEAETEFAAALEAIEEHYGPEHRATAWSLSGLGLARVALGEHADAISPLERAVKIWRRTPNAYPQERARAQAALDKARAAANGPG